ncbi:alpha/beta fold hydrolase [Haloferula chungangensis]|uniref:Alpha/beta fold hydrolase n=1 Tax=Haloferula chungangensis TaxID=1048331 RepID=A0ABW2L4G0_9BACT
MKRQIPQTCRLIRLATGLLFALLIANCAPSYTLVKHSPNEELRHETFQYRKWLRSGSKPDTVIIALHGFCGASIDYENLAKHLLKNQPETAVYAYEVRGQGRDPLKERRGDIDDPANWSTDLLAFTQLVKKENPDARIVWFGESMGSLIVSHTYNDMVSKGGAAPCDAIGVTSPVVAIRGDFPTWKKELVRGFSKLAPGARVSIDALSGGEPVQMTEDSIHSEQSETNSWHVDKHTLRLLVTLGDMIETMPECASHYQVPTLVLHGGQDFFTSPDDVKSFVSQVPASTDLTRKYYPKGHHLLMYDSIKDEVIEDIATWLDELRDQG